jgi:3-oxoacyl-[acyl-carrier-protein] synthase II
MRRAVVSGAGVVSAYGVGLGTFWGGLREGRQAVRPIRSFDVATFQTKVAAEVPVVKTDRAWLEKHLEMPISDELEASGALRDRKASFALVAAAEAWRAANCGEGEHGAALVMALGLEQALLEDFAPMVKNGVIDWSEEPTLSRIRFRTPVDLPARLLRGLLQLEGPMIVNASACAAGTLAVSHAAQLIEKGRADVVVCGGADSMINPLGVGGMTRLGAPSPRNSPDACRPFDARRDGLAMGEGAAVFILEEESRARSRGVKPLAAVAGWAGNQDGYRVTAPRPDGSQAKAAMLRAVEKAGIGRVDYINAHGTGTPLNDPAEARAIREAFGGDVPVSSIKGAIGHLMAASGAIEIAACLLAFEGNFLPGTVNHRERDRECDIRVLADGCEARVDWVLSNSFGFGGQNASIVLGRA